jgi:hypothetical protein
VVTVRVTNEGILWEKNELPHMESQGLNDCMMVAVKMNTIDTENNFPSSSKCSLFYDVTSHSSILHGVAMEASEKTSSGVIKSYPNPSLPLRSFQQEQDVAYHGPVI